MVFFSSKVASMRLKVLVKRCLLLGFAAFLIWMVSGCRFNLENIISQAKSYKENLSHSTYIRLVKSLPGLSSDLLYNSHNQRQDSDIPKTIAVVIAAQGRTGASLLGELFNRNDEVFYQFEPLRVFESINNLVYYRMNNKSLQETYSEKAVKFLEDAITCNFESSSASYFFNIDEFGGRQRSRALCRPPFCDTSNSNCRGLHYSEVSKVCRNQYKFKVIKEQEFRLPYMDFSSLTRITIKHPDISVRVIHFVRDPRAYLYSLKRFGWFSSHHLNTVQQPDAFVSRRCNETLNNILQMRKDGQIQYMLLRYEDLILNPVVSLDKLQHQTGIRLNEDVRHWFRAVLDGQQNAKLTRYVDGHKTGVEVMEYWREYIHMDLVKLVQEKCAELMSMLGYTIVDDEITLRNLNVKLVSASRHV